MKLLGRYKNAIASIVADAPAYPQGRFSGTGIVICAGGRSYTTCAWVLVKLLRSLGCRLPIEVWYRCPSEMNKQMIGALQSIPDTRCVDASRVPGRPPEYKLNGWEIKPFAITNSRFREVLFLDCDNAPTRDPSFLFSCEPYRTFGAVFWPDRWMAEGDPYWTIHPDAWTACDVAYKGEPEFESGQMVIDKRRSWHALQLALFYNMHSSFFYRLLLGDKDTFHMAWRRLDQQYAMPMFRPTQDTPDGPVLYQHDFAGRRLFQHRNQDKWDYDGNNMRIPGFRHEERCMEFIAELRDRWDGIVRRYPVDYTTAERMAYDEVTSQHLLHYRHLGVESRLLQFRPDFTLGIGRSKWESHWEIEQDETGEVRLILSSPLRKMVVMDRGSDCSWSGRCLHFERELVSVNPVAKLPRPRRRVAETIRGALDWLPDQEGPHAQSLKATGMFVYHRVGHDARLLQFKNDQTIGQGAATCERWWYVDERNCRPALVIQGEHGTTCRLEGVADRLWVGKWSRFEEMPVAVIPEALGSLGTQQADYGRVTEIGDGPPLASLGYYGPPPSLSYYGASPATLSYYGASPASLSYYGASPASRGYYG